MLAEQLGSKRGSDTIRVLLVEDNPGDVGLVEAALQEAGDPSIELHVERRLQPALSRLSKERFSVVLLDLNLPDSLGFDTVTAVQAAVPRVPIVVMTGNTDEQFARSAINAGVQDYLIKDYVSPGTLVRSIFFSIERKHIENDLHALERMASAASSSLDMNSLIDMILGTFMEELGAQRAALILETEGRETVKRSVGNEEGTGGQEYQRLEHDLVQHVLRTGQTNYYQKEDDDGNVERTMLKVPMAVGTDSKGVVEVEWSGGHPESIREVTLLRLAADKMAVGIANANAYESVRRSERMAEEERLRLRTIIDNLPVGILLTDATGKEIESNSYRDRLWGGGKREPYQRIEDLMEIKAWWADTSEPVIECPVVKALKYDQTTLGAVIDIERFDGTNATILASATPIHDRTGRTIGAVGVQQNITEQIELERELTEAKDRAEFYLDLLTHDIDNSLAAASGYIQLTELSEGLDEKTKRWVAGAEASLQESIDLISTIRKVQRSRLMAMERSTVDISSMLSEVVATTEQKNPGVADIHLSTYDNANVMGTGLLRDLFNNLIGNAIKHAAGRVTVDVEVKPVKIQNQEFVRVDVADNGKGIPDSLKERLFKKGSRGSSKTPGQGLGLFLAQNIAAGAGGRLWVEDRVPGDHTKGARFVVLLPRAD